ncbi:MAG: sugar phosphate isomerase/epimerase [Spirochaetes bacterium]|nr:sugar phosphate isomerase/epimerase [Spirochaetota bacterium]
MKNKNKISCRVGVYESIESAAKHLPQAGIRFAEINAAPAGELEKTAAIFSANGVTPLTLSGELNCDNPASIDAVIAACAAAQSIGVSLFFLSTKGSDRAAATLVLKRVGDAAAKHGVTLCLETHPPFCQNADDMLRTMHDVAHPNVRINFDTANIFYYNQNMDSADELKKIIASVASVHLKDTDGGFKSGNFPVFGKGVVRFPEIFAQLHRAGFTGPLTMEVEGALVSGLDIEKRHAVVTGCMEYLKSIGEA